MMWTVALFLAPAWAEPGPGAGRSADGVLWDNIGGHPVIRVEGKPGTPVTLTIRAKLGECSTTWTRGPVNIDADGRIDVDLAVPQTAWLDDAAADYVTDLFAIVDIGTLRATPGPGYLGWTRGRRAPPVVMTTDELVVHAPQGVLDPELRDPEARPDDRTMPDLPRCAPGNPNVAPSDTEVTR